MENVLDLYTDYLLASFGQTSATGLENLLDGTIKHDTVTRLLTRSDFTAKDLWLAIKPLVRTHQNADGCLIFDDCVIEKEYTDENELLNSHFQCI